MICAQNIICDDKSLMTLLFDKSVLHNLKCRVDDYLMIMQSKFNPRMFIVAKADSGYRIRRYPRVKKTYQVNVSFKFNDINEFDFQECTYFIKKNNIIRILLRE